MIEVVLILFKIVLILQKFWQFNDHDFFNLLMNEEVYTMVIYFKMKIFKYIFLTSLQKRDCVETLSIIQNICQSLKDFYLAHIVYLHWQDFKHGDNKFNT